MIAIKTDSGRDHSWRSYDGRLRHDRYTGKRQVHHEITEPERPAAYPFVPIFRCRKKPEALEERRQ